LILSSSQIKVFAVCIFKIGTGRKGTVSCQTFANSSCSFRGSSCESVSKETLRGKSDGTWPGHHLHIQVVVRRNFLELGDENAASKLCAASALLRPAKSEMASEPPEK
jgi:hypothetical protein